jgi:hypothetical protein
MRDGTRDQLRSVLIDSLRAAAAIDPGNEA